MVIIAILEKTPYELLKGRKPNISYFRVFGCKCFILNNRKDNLGKFDAKFYEEILLGYSSTSKAYRVYNHRTTFSEESIHVAFDESSPQKTGKGICFDISCVLMENLINKESTKEDPPCRKDEDINEDKEESLHEDDKQETSKQLPLDWIIPKDHLLDQIQGDIKRGVSTRS